MVIEGKKEALTEALALRSDKEKYGINILPVQETRGYETVTHIANARRHRVDPIVALMHI